MPSNEKLKGRLDLVAAQTDDDLPKLEVRALDARGEVVHRAKVKKDGDFDLPKTALEKAHRVHVGPADDDSPEAAERALVFRPEHFAEAADHGVIDIARDRWVGWRPPFKRCVSGNISHCTPWPWVVADLLREVTVVQKLANPPRVQPGLVEDLQLSIFPQRQPICDGLIEVYRRVCCCDPWVFDDARLPELELELEDLVPEIPDWPPRGPRPDPPPIRTLPFFKDGALDRHRMEAPFVLEKIRTLPPRERHAFILDRPYLWCHEQCGPAKKVGEGLIQGDGEFQVCWSAFPEAFLFNCHEEFAFRVKQVINGETVVIYDGVGAGRWFEMDEPIDLVSYHPDAVTCRRDQFPHADGAYVLLQDIGNTESWRLETPDANGWDSVQAPGINGGLLDPEPNLAAAKGKLKNRNWGGVLNLRYHFSEEMRTLGAKYYRVSVTATNNGQPFGNRTPLPVPSWKRYRSLGNGKVAIDNVALGPEDPNQVGGQDNLYEIPYDVPGDNLEWQNGQYHAILDTRQFNQAAGSLAGGRYLVTVEVFDKNGNRLRPENLPGSPGAGTDKPFHFLRWQEATGVNATKIVPYAALTHLFWWDNRSARGLIGDLQVDQSAPPQSDCQFLEGGGGSKFRLMYEAYHPEPRFLFNHSLYWVRGLSGVTGDLTTPHPSPDNEGPPPQASDEATFAAMLGTDGDGDPHDKCAFSLNLRARVKTTDGGSLRLEHLDYVRQGAFALVRTDL